MPKPKTLLLSHGKPSKDYLGIVRGEMANAERFKDLLHSCDCQTGGVVDIFEIFGGEVQKLYEPLAELNVELARCGYAMLDEVELEEAVHVKHHILSHDPDYIFILSWAWSGAALYATGIHKEKPVASKLYVHHENEMILPKLYQSHTLLLTESLLANQRAIHYGIPSWQLIHLPHHYPPCLQGMTKSRRYVENLIAKSQKKIELKEKTMVIGSVSRLEFGKNCEFALQTVERLHEEGHDVLFVLKGGFEEFSPYPMYRDWLREVIDSLKDKKWFLWDPTPSTHEEIFQAFASFDIFLHLSGAEAGSNVIVEALAMGLPTVILDGTTNPSLFKGGPLFVNHNGEMPKDLIHPFRSPDKEDLFQKTKEIVMRGDFRKSLGLNCLKIAQERFSAVRTRERLPLLFKAMKHYHENSSSVSVIKKEVEALYEEDLKRYDRDHFRP